jgi:hypothetical protein
MCLALAVVWASTWSGIPSVANGAVLAAAGDIACDPDDPYFNGGRGVRRNCRQLATSRLLRGADRVVPLGDTQYEHSNLRNFRRSYDRSWGRYLRVSRPVVGNHEYGPPRRPNLGARDYWRYFGERRAGQRGKGWYSFDLGAWHVVGLNSMCRSSHKPRFMQREVGCGRGSAQQRWLERDLAANGRRCILASWHHPRFASGSDDWREVAPLWRTLQNNGADVVLSGHAHAYERFARQSATGGRTAKGMRQFVVGTGGASLAGPPGDVEPHSKKRARSFGVLRLQLKPGRYRWKFVRTGGRALDRGSTSCR